MEEDQRKPTENKSWKDSSHDLGLVLVGHALSPGPPREYIMGSVLPEDCPKLIGDLLCGIRDQKMSTMRSWLESHGGAIEHGMTPIEAVARVIRERAERRRIDRLGCEITAAVRIGSVPQLVEKLKEAISTLEELEP